MDAHDDADSGDDMEFEPESDQTTSVMEVLKQLQEFDPRVRPA